jgi:hypothetical protein
MIQLENRWKDLDEIWHGLCAIGDSPKIILFQLPAINNNTNMTAEQIN